MIGYDFNGVVDTGQYIPTRDDVIVTGNTIDLAPKVLDWLREHNIWCPVYFNPYEYTPEDAAMWKVEMIFKLKIDKFYEDDPVQYKIIDGMVNAYSSNKCEVIKV